MEVETLDPRVAKVAGRLAESAFRMYAPEFKTRTLPESRHELEDKILNAALIDAEVLVFSDMELENVDDIVAGWAQHPTHGFGGWTSQ